nr:immunoglobulin light chain junction region [Macaca mulatta]
CLQSKTSPYTF